MNMTHCRFIWLQSSHIGVYYLIISVNHLHKKLIRVNHLLKTLVFQQSKILGLKTLPHRLHPNFLVFREAKQQDVAFHVQKFEKPALDQCGILHLLSFCTITQPVPIFVSFLAISKFKATNPVLKNLLFQFWCEMIECVVYKPVFI